jgi:hypothetical protein
MATLKRYLPLIAVAVAVLYFRQEIGNALPKSVAKFFKFGT